MMSSMTTTATMTPPHRGTRQRQRIGGDLPFRDDPSAPPSARLESFTRGGYGPSDVDPKVHSSWMRQCWGKCGDWCHPARRQNTIDDKHYYLDSFNDLPWSCTIGTSDESGIWLNQSDAAGTIMAVLVWVLIGYSALTMTLLAQTGGLPTPFAVLYTLLAAAALACHVKTSLTDPGAVPASAVPTHEQRLAHSKLSMCSQCQTFKPPLSHHCRICNRCISRMDHHCPWMNNCVGAANLKHFLLFLIYTWLMSACSLLLLGWNYFFCADDGCVFTTVLTQLVRLMTLLSVGAFLFTSSMLMNVIYGILTGIGTIDRLKKKAQGTMTESEEEAIPLTDIFGIGPLWEWVLPTDPLFDDYDRVMGYATPQRLLREQMRDGADDGASVVTSRDSFGMPV